MNHRSYLRDDSGGRRYWPIACSKIDLDALRLDREQIWAEVVHLYKAGAKWWPSTPAEVKLCTSQQAEREEDCHPWTGLVLNWLETSEAKQLLEERDSPLIPGGYFTCSDIMVRAIQLRNDQCTKANQTHVGQLMKKLDWKSDRLPQSMGKLRVYIPRPPGE